MSGVTDLAQHSRFERVRRSWTELSLARQFSLAAAAVLLAGMLVIGVWVTRQIEEGVTRNTAAATALYVDSVIAPLLPNLRGEAGLSYGAQRALDETLSQGALGQRLASFKIWKDGGLIAYASDPKLIGARFEPTESLRQAWAGRVTAEFDSLEDDENASERVQNVPLLEIYSPIREPWSGEVVAVAEFYEVADELQSNLLAARLRSWLVVGMATLCMIGLLFGIVLRGSDMIATQRKALEARVADLSRLLRQNEELRLRVQGASRRAAALNERFLKRISADLHDGPAQLLALASLRIGDARPPDAASPEPGELDSIRDYLDEAMREIRSICRGLTLPHIEAMRLPELLLSAVAAHEQRTGTTVSVSVPDTAPDISAAEKICVYRFVQEGLNNAFRHARGVGQSVRAEVSAGALAVSVSDQGGGFDAAADDGEGLGLAGLRDRVESLGGGFEVTSSAAGTRVVMRLNLSPEVAR
jgi:signal transduction histidine kinase